MIRREIITQLQKACNSYKIVTVVGPRYAGKTTMLRAAFSRRAYANLEESATKKFATLDSKGFLAGYNDGGIFDEIQFALKTIAAIAAKANTTNQKGKFILVSSQDNALQTILQQSLGIHTGLLQLLPLSFFEVEQFTKGLTVDEYLFQGFFPDIYQEQLDPVRIYKLYLQNYLQRDIAPILGDEDLNLFQRFMQLCARNIGAVINTNFFAKELSIPAAQVEKWLQILEGAFIIYRLPSIEKGLRHKIYQGKKLYFIDVGLAANLLELENVGQISHYSERNQLFTNMLIIEALKKCCNFGISPQLFYYHDHSEQQVPLMFYDGKKYLPLFFSVATTIDQMLQERIKEFAAGTENSCYAPALVYCGDNCVVDNLFCINYKNMAGLIK